MQASILFSCRIADLQDILQRKDRILQIIAKEADEVAERHGNDRRTAIVTNSKLAEKIPKPMILQTPNGRMSIHLCMLA